MPKWLKSSPVLDCCRDTLYDRFSDSLKKGQNQAKVALRRLQWRSATTGNVAMQIWLGKNILGQSSKYEIDSHKGMAIQVVHFGSKNPKEWQFTLE